VGEVFLLLFPGWGMYNVVNPGKRMCTVVNPGRKQCRKGRESRYRERGCTRTHRTASTRFTVG